MQYTKTLRVLGTVHILAIVRYSNCSLSQQLIVVATARNVCNAIIGFAQLNTTIDCRNFSTSNPQFACMQLVTGRIDFDRRGQTGNCFCWKYL